MKLLFALVKNGNAEYVRGQQVGRELDALELRVNGSGQGLRQRGLARARIILQQHVTARRERRQQMPGGPALAAHDFGNVARYFPVRFPCGFKIGCGHL